MFLVYGYDNFPNLSPSSRRRHVAAVVDDEYVVGVVAVVLVVLVVIVVDVIDVLVASTSSSRRHHIVDVYNATRTTTLSTATSTTVSCRLNRPTM